MAGRSNEEEEEKEGTYEATSASDVQYKREADKFDRYGEPTSYLFS